MGAKFDLSFLYTDKTAYRTSLFIVNRKWFHVYNVHSYSLSLSQISISQHLFIWHLVVILIYLLLLANKNYK